LRALSDGGPNLHNTSTLSVPQKYKLAEYRYGREEMLALFTEKTTIPDELKECKEILSEKCQIPLALTPMSEEEHRLWSRCVNSDVVLRLAGKTGANTSSERIPSERGPLRGKGPGIERGRGRGRSAYYQRGSSYDDDVENGSERRDFRPKPFDRNSGDDAHRDKGFDRPLGRNEEENSRRKDLRSTDNWRTGNRNDDRSWRSRGRGDDGRGRVTSSWRNDERDHDENDYRNGFCNKKSFNNQHRDRLNSDWDDVDDEERRGSLPEWSLDDGSASEAKVGTFDASGAFREENIDDDAKDSEESDKNVRESDKQDGESFPKSGKNTPENKSKKSNSIEQHCHEEPSAAAKEVVPASIEPSTNSKPPMESPNSEISQAPVRSTMEEDGFARLEKAAESMVAQWTAEEDQKERQCKDSVNKMMVLPVHHEDAYKWFYRDPQGELQGPFTAPEMLEWFTAGYFSMDLLVRRGCDEVFSQLGELINTWNRVPFVPGQHPPPIRNISSSPSLISTIQSSPANNIQLRQQQLMQQQQQIQRQMYLNQQLQMQTQLRQLLAQLKQREGFSELTPQEQQEVLVQHYMSTQQLQRQLHPNIPQEQPTVSNPLVQFVPLVAGNSTPLIAQSSIWDLNGGVMTASTLEEMQRQEQERREAEEKQRKILEEQRRRNEEEEHRRRIEELQRKMEEERKRKQEEERRKKEEEERIRLEEERRKIEEEKRRLEEQQRRQEEIKRLEELSRKQREEDMEKRRREAEELERKKLQEQLEQERQRKFEAEMLRHEQEEVYKRLQEQKKAWGSQAHSQTNAPQNTVSLAEIQRLQEQKEREERMKQAQLQQNMQALFQVQQAQQHKQHSSKQQLTWANSNCQSGPIKTLAEIQREEAERVAKQKQIDDQKHLQHASVTGAGIWSNAASQLTWKANTTAWDGAPSKSTSSGFWDSDTTASATRKSTTGSKLSESALPSSNKSGCNQINVKSNTNSRSRKDEEVVMKLFENQRRQQNDDFTQWCIDSLEKFQSFIDIPTFVAFLKDVEPPYEVSDYVKSYLGDSKETREFAKQFVEKRSFYRNQAKKEASEELMWGPAPAITPSANKSVNVPSSGSAGGDSEFTGFVKAGKKKKRGKKVDNSILGFTVQADPDRVNVGEIEQIND
ncbi:PERQ amino acid-rich with GYF domain-containing protein 2-like isoform X5, partial [Dinothrombium tinctorium]